MKRPLLPIPAGLRGASALAAALLLAATWISWAAWATRQAAQAEARQAAARLARAETRLHRLENDLENIHRQAARFRDWQSQGLVGPARPREWGLFLDNLAREMGLTGLHSEFLAPASRTEPGYSLQTTPLKLHLELLHEEDLLRFLAALDGQAPALVSIRACRLARLPLQSSPPPGTPPRLEADCDMDWITADGQAREPA